ncbi:MAG: type II toxin-antitoxin system PemK/MazF family toxin [Gaiella sp.]
MTRGDIVRLRGPRRAKGQGREPRGPRYGVVVQASDLLALSTVVVVPTSTRAQEASFRPAITVAGTATRALADELTAIDGSRVAETVGRLSWQEIGELDRALQTVLGLR